jgi:hypothetical protein
MGSMRSMAGILLKQLKGNFGGCRPEGKIFEGENEEFNPNSPACILA